MARYAMEFCAIESCGKCTPCRIGSTRGVEVIDRDRRENRVARQNVELLRDLCDTMLHGSLCALGGLTPYPGAERARTFPGGFAAGSGRPKAAVLDAKLESRRLCNRMYRKTDLGDTGTNVSVRADWSRSRSTASRVTVPAGTSVMRAAARRRRRVPKLCATDMLERVRLLPPVPGRDRGRKGYPGLVHDAGRAGHEGDARRTDKLAELRRGVMELYISDHPLDCLTCPANGNCELQEMAGVVGLREVRYGYDGANHLEGRERRDRNPYFTFDPSKCIVCSRCVRACEEVQGTFALTVAGRGFDSKVSASQGNRFMDSECVSCGACVQACPTATLMEKSVIEKGQPEHSVDHDLRLLRRRLLVPRRDEGRRGRAHGAQQGRPRQPRPLLRQGPLRDGATRRIPIASSSR